MALFQNGVLEATDLKVHKFGSRGSWPSDNMGYIYTSKVGLVDIAHVRDQMDMTKWLYDQLLVGKSTIILEEGTCDGVQDADDARRGARPRGLDRLRGELGARALDLEGEAQDFTAFSPEDIPSNIIGIEIGTRAIAAGGSFDSTAATNLEAVVKTELGARPKADTTAALAKVRGPGKWIDGLNLLRRNFDGDPWMVGLPVDAKATPGWLTPARFAAQYPNFAYDMNSAVNHLGYRVNLSNIQTATNTIRALYKAAHPGWDRP